METLKVRVRFTSNLLGTSPNDPEVYDRFVASKSGDEEKAKLDAKLAMATKEAEEAEGLEQLDKGVTIFQKMEDGTPYLRGYQIKGFIKEALKFLKKTDEWKSVVPAAFKQGVDGLVFIFPDIIPLLTNEDVKMLQRPLRAETAQGPRVALASSEMLGADTFCEFTITVLSKSWIKPMLAALEYGELHGMGQWRNGGYGRFVYELLDEKGNVVGGNAEGNGTFHIG